MSPKKKEPAQRPAPAPADAVSGPPRLSLPWFSNGWKLLLFPVCVLQPAAGFTLGLLYARQEDGEARRFGYVCLALALLGSIAAAFGGRGHGGMHRGDSLLQPFF